VDGKAVTLSVEDRPSNWEVRVDAGVLEATMGPYQASNARWGRELGEPWFSMLST